jgi:hypothetical protein
MQPKFETRRLSRATLADPNFGIWAEIRTSPRWSIHPADQVKTRNLQYFPRNDLTLCCPLTWIVPSANPRAR